MANTELLEALSNIAKERDIPEEDLLLALANALLAAYKRIPESAEDAEVEINPETGEIKVVGLELDLDGNVISEWDATPSDFGRIAAQTVKQVLMQGMTDIQRRKMYEEFANREGDIVTGVVRQTDNRFLLLDIGRVEALLPQAEQIPLERSKQGDRMKVYIVEVRNSVKGPQIVVSRTHPALVAKLFELEVPEIANGLVEIKAIAREPGHRSKIAIASNDQMIDPVGACVGARGSRVRNVMTELGSERVDVIPYSEDPVEFIEAALQPARIREVQLDEEQGIATVIVHAQQLSLAIGKEGQNARLAARLTGWRIDIRSDEEEVATEVWTDGDATVEVVSDGTEVVVEASDAEGDQILADRVGDDVVVLEETHEESAENAESDVTPEDEEAGA
jgi:transcription termination/antitermination protein NusA